MRFKTFVSRFELFIDGKLCRIVISYGFEKGEEKKNLKKKKKGYVSIRRVYLFIYYRFFLPLEKAESGAVSLQAAGSPAGLWGAAGSWG